MLHRVPKLTLNFHVTDGPTQYEPHKSKLLYESKHESNCPIIRELREKMEELVRCSFNFASMIMYVKENNHISLHRDSDQLNGLSEIDQIERNEVIATLSLIGHKILQIKDFKTSE